MKFIEHSGPHTGNVEDGGSGSVFSYPPILAETTMRIQTGLSRLMESIQLLSGEKGYRPLKDIIEPSGFTLTKE